MSPKRSKPLLSIENAGRQVDEGWIWRHLSFEVAAGMSTAVVGPSGSGKTLLLRALAGLDPLDEGSISFKGRPITSCELPRYRAQVMYLPQRPAFTEGTVEENLRQVFRFQIHRTKSFDRQQLLEHLNTLGRDSRFLRRRVAVLSGGERQIVALLRALQLRPAALLLDEPTANLDAENTRQIEALVSAWKAEDEGRGLVWTSHNAGQIERMTTRQITLTGITRNG